MNSKNVLAIDAVHIDRNSLRCLLLQPVPASLSNRLDQLLRSLEVKGELYQQDAVTGRRSKQAEER